MVYISKFATFQINTRCNFWPSSGWSPTRLQVAYAEEHCFV